MFGRLLSIFFLFFFTAYRLPLPPLFAQEMGIVAVVNDEVITQAELDRAVAPVYFQLQAEHSPEELAAQLPEIRKQTLEQLIEERLMLQEAKNPRPVEVSKGKIGIPPAITVSEYEVEEMIAQIQGRFETPEEFAQALAERGVTLEDLKARYKDQITVQKLIDREILSRVAISPSEVTAYYDAHPQNFELPAAVQAALILIVPQDTLDLPRAKDQAEGLSRQIAQGADFYDLAKRYSQGPNPKMGGRLGYIEKGKMLKEIDQALFTLKAGEISPVIRTPAGFHLFKVESVRPPRRQTLEESQGLIQRILQQGKSAERYKEWISRLRESSYVSIKQ